MVTFGFVAGAVDAVDVVACDEPQAVSAAVATTIKSTLRTRASYAQ